MRAKLKKARRELGLTQQAMADEVGISLRYYQRIEDDEVLGSISIWDKLEDITGIHQRRLREMKANHHDQETNQ